MDGHHFSEYHHRVPFTSVDTLQIQGSVRLTRVDVTINKIYPSFPPKTAVPSGALDATNPVIFLKFKLVYDTYYFQQVLPFAALLGDKLSVGEEVQLYGNVKPFPSRCVIFALRKSEE